MERHQKFSTMAGSTAVSQWNSKFDTLVTTIGTDFNKKIEAYSALISENLTLIQIHQVNQ